MFTGKLSYAEYTSKPHTAGKAFLIYDLWPNASHSQNKEIEF